MVVRCNNVAYAASLAAIILVLILGSSSPPFAQLANGLTNHVTATSSNPLSPTQGTMAHTPNDVSKTDGSSPSSVRAHPVSFLLNRESVGATTASPASTGVQNHGGPTMHTTITFAIFWLPSSDHYEQFTHGNDSRFESLIIQFLQDVGGNSYYNILNQYPDSINGTPIDSSVFGGSYIDTTSYPASGTTSHPLSDVDIQVEVARALDANGWTQGSDKVFLVFTGFGINSCLNFSFCTFTNPGYCAYHSFFTINSQPVIYGNMPDFGGVGGRCTPREPSPNNDFYADPEINLVSHELFEGVSDPQLNAWYDDVSGNEIGDLCAWQFGSVGSDGTNVILNGHSYLVQQEWSNYSNGCALSYGPTKLVGLALTPAQGPGLAASIHAFNVTYSSTGTIWWTIAFANTTRIYVDPSTQIIVSDTSLGSNGTERWCFAETCSDLSLSIVNGTTSSFVYYDLLPQGLSDAIIDGGSPSVIADFIDAPGVPSGVNSPQSTSISLSSTPEIVWVLRGTKLNVTSPGNGSLGERWVSATSNWTINDAFVVPTPITLFHQYLTTFTYQMIGGGTGFSPPFVRLSVLGQSQSATLGESIWADAAGYQYSVQLSGSSTTERWLTGSASGSVASPGIISPIYYHQYSVSVVYSISGGGTPDPPLFASVQLGLSVSVRPGLQPSTMWLDSGSQFSITNPLGGSTPEERWQTPNDTFQSVENTTNVSFTYYHQYYLKADSGSIEPLGSGWYDSGSQIPLLLDYVWNVSGQGLVRQNLLSYTLDGHSFQVSRQGSGFVILPTINMTAPHSVIVFSTIQYYMTVSDATLLGSQTGDDWFDAGSQFTIQANYSESYTASSPLYVYDLVPGFQIVSSSPLGSVSWSNSDADLSFQSNNANVTIYVPTALEVSPSYVYAGGASQPYHYSSGTGLLTLAGLSNHIIVHFESASNPSSALRLMPWLIYIIIGLLGGITAIAGLVLLRLRTRGRWTDSRPPTGAE